MIDPVHIVRAIAAHAKWKYYLRQAIKTGTSQWRVPEVRVDDRCEFGTWLGTLAPADERGPHARAVRAQHTEFHRAAATVLALALTGRRDESEAAIAPGSHFAEVSKKLTLAMMAWKDSLQQAATQAENA